MSVCTGIRAKDVIGTSLHWKGFYKEEQPSLADLIVDGAYDQITKVYPDITSRSQLIEGAYEAIDFFPSMGEKGKWLHFTASPVYDTKRNIIAALETIIDITDLKLAEETVKSANIKLNTLTKITRHDIINQLTILLGYVEFLEQTLPEDKSIKKHAEKIKNAAQAIQNLIVFTREYQNLGMELACWHSLDQLIHKAVDTANARSLKIEIDPRRFQSMPIRSSSGYLKTSLTMQSGMAKRSPRSVYSLIIKTAQERSFSRTTEQEFRLIRKTRFSARMQEKPRNSAFLFPRRFWGTMTFQ